MKKLNEYHLCIGIDGKQKGNLGGELEQSLCHHNQVISKF